MSSREDMSTQCRRCILDSRTPGITINPRTGLCPWCEEEAPKISAEGIHDLLSGKRGEEFDVVFALSGGKDSCYTLYHLKKNYPDLRILAAQFDNGFISDMALTNAQRFCELTDSTYRRLTLDPSLLYRVFRGAAESINVFPVVSRIRASDICNTCIGIVKQKVIELALVHRAPLTVFAFSPGQTAHPCISLPASSLRWFRTLFQKELEAMGIQERDAFLIDPRLLAGTSEVTMVHPLLAWNYDKERVEQAVLDLGWKRPDLADKISTNCLLNAFANENHLQKYGIHPYAFDLAALVREGRLSRQEAIRSLETQPSAELIRYAKETLSIP